MKLRQPLLALGAATLALTLIGCSPGGDSSPDDGAPADVSFPEGSPMAAINEAGVVKVGVQTTYPLIGLQELNGFSGIDIEIAKLIAEELGIAEDKIEFVPVTTPTREPFIENDQIDFAVAAYSITQSREDVIDFAGPYLESPSALMVQKGNPQSISTLDDMVGKKLCLPAGSNQEAVLRESHPELVDSFVFFDSSAKCRESVLNGSVDASTTEVAILTSFVAENPDELEVVQLANPYTTSFYGIGVKQEADPVFCEWINEKLGAMFEDGRWAAAYDRTLGTVLGDAPAPPELATCGDAPNTL